jgi:hypothetical protein
VMASLIIAVFVPLLFIAGLYVLRAAEAERSSTGARTFRLRFGRQTDANDVTTFIAGLSGARPPAHLHWLRVPTLVFETRAVHGLVEHYLIVPRELTGVVMSNLRSALPSVRIEPVVDPQAPQTEIGRELGITATKRPLRTERAEAASRSLLATLQPLRADEEVVVQWAVTPARNQRPPRLRMKSQDESNGGLLPVIDGYELLPHTEALKAEKAKLAEPLFSCVGRIGVKASEKSRARYLLGREQGSYQLLSAPGVELRRRPSVSLRRAAFRLNRRRVPIFEWPATLNSAELSGVVCWPLGSTPTPGVLTGAARQLPPSADIPTEGCVIGRSTYPGSERPVAISEADRRLHMLVVGPTGTGKTSLLTGLSVADAQAGRGLVIIEPKDLCDEVLKRVPPERVKDVIILDPADDERPVGLNLLDTSETPAELVAERVVGVFLSLFGSTLVGPRSEDLLRASLLTGMTNPDFTLVDLPLLITDEQWRRPYVEGVAHDRIGLAKFWSAYEALKPNEQAQVAAPLLNKLRQVVLRNRVRYCLGQSHPKLNLREALDSGKLLFVPLRKGLIGETTARFFGSVLLTAVWQTIQARAAVPADERRPVHLYVDEAADFMHGVTSLGEVLAQSRSYSLSVNVALQHLGQAKREIRQDFEANCRSKVLFALNARDARAFEAELRPYVTAEDLQGLGRFEVIAQLAVGQRIAPPVTAVTLPPPPETHRTSSAIAWSRQHYGRERSDIEAEMAKRHETAVPAASIGRRRASKGKS